MVQTKKLFDDHQIMHIRHGSEICYNTNYTINGRLNDILNMGYHGVKRKFEYLLFQKMMKELRIVKHKVSKGLHFTNEDLQVK